MQEILPTKKQIQEYYVQLKPLLKEILNNIQMKLNIVIALRVMPTYKARVKSFDSYYKKVLKIKSQLQEQTTEPICLTDMIGIRVICSFLEDLSNVEKQIANHFQVVEVERKGADKTFSEFGYESIHVLIRIPKECLPEGKEKLLPSELVCEIQIRTILQDAWAEVEHELIYKSQFSPFDSPLRRKLAAIKANLSLSDIIFQEIRDYQDKLKKELNTRHETFYDKADALSGSFSPKKSEEESEEKTDISRPAPFVWGAIDDMILQALHEHNAGNMDNAISIYTKIIDSKPSPSPEALSVIYKHRGMAYFAQDEYDKAICDFKNSIDFDKNNYMAWYYMGIVLSIQEKNKEAIQCFDNSIEINKYQAHTHYRRAISYYNIGDFAKSLEDLTKASRLGLDSSLSKNLREKLMEKFDMKV